MVMRLFMLFLILGAVVLGMLLRPGPAAVRAEFFDEPPHLPGESPEGIDPWPQMENMEEPVLEATPSTEGLAAQSSGYRILQL
jgi:hypothetical protein